MSKPVRAITVVAVVLTAAVYAHAEAGPSELEEQVLEVERAFARTMADRDHAAFAAFLSGEAVFLSGTTVRRGKEAVDARDGMAPAACPQGESNPCPHLERVVS